MLVDHSHIPRSAAAYNGLNLRMYDAFVLRFTSPRAWGVQADELAAMYRRHLSSNHAEVGVGSGHFLVGEQSRVAWSSLSLIDPNPAALNFVARRLGNPVTEKHVGDIVLRDTLPQNRYQSVAANYVLHCITDSSDSKQAAIANLADLVDDEGVLFGATVLGRAEHNRLGRIVMRICNALGVFNNTNDSEPALTEHLRQHFRSVHVERRNTIALFTAAEPIR